MRYAWFVLILMLTPSLASGQSEGWLKVIQGTALYLDPAQHEWVPVADRQQVVLHTYVLTQEATQARLFKETDAVDLPPGAYFYLDDALPKTRVGVVAALTRIEAAQLPATIQAPDDASRPVGLTYGTAADTTTTSTAIPHREARAQAIRWFLDRERYEAALLSLKRMMTRFPSLYTQQAYVEQLLQLYDRLALHGFLLDESERLLTVRASEPFTRMVHDWHETAKTHLLHRERE
jgi:hypothetical protein